MAAVVTMPSGPQDIPGSRVGTPPPQLDPSHWSGSPESPEDELATPQTPHGLHTFDHQPRPIGKRRLTYDYNSGPSFSPELPTPSTSGPATTLLLHRRQSSTPFLFEIGETTSTTEQPPAEPVQEAEMAPAPPTPSSGTGQLGKAVRRRLERSKTFRRMQSATDTTATADGGPQDTNGPRFKALRRLRAQSLSSISGTSSGGITPSGSSAQLSLLESDGFNVESLVPPGGRKGSSAKAVIQNAKQRIQRRRSGPVPQTTTLPVVLASAGLQGPSPPQPSDEIVWGTLSYRGSVSRQPEVEELPQTDYFTTMLPRELKVAVFRTLLEMNGSGQGRWDGVNGARRELVRLSRVSKEWRSLCFDGSLWQNADYTALANVLPAETMRTILDYARPCVKDLNLEGLEALPGQAVTGLLPALPSPGAYSSFSSLTTLDLRGCHTMLEADIIDLLSMSPRLKRLNLKGSRVVTSSTLITIKDRVEALEALDISRCWNLRFHDVEQMILWSSPRQRAALKSLRLAGLPNASGGHLLLRVASLPHLETLDLLGCSWLGMADIEDLIHGLGESPSPLKHLVLSGCTGLTVEALDLLVGRLPHMECFEAANLDTVFYLDPPPTLARLVRSMPLLRRLDLDSTGRYGGVDDRVLYELIPGATPGSTLEVSHLEHLRIGNAKFVSAGAMRRIIRELPDLKVFIANGTDADNAVAREFINRHLEGGEISLVDCHRLTPDACIKLAPKVRPRTGWEGYLSLPFAFTEVERSDRPVLHTFWGWDKVQVPPFWRDARAAGERCERVKSRDEERRPSLSWWRPATPQDDIDMERGACVIM